MSTPVPHVLLRDNPGDRCAFDSNHCSASMSGHGGFQSHHEYPEFMGGQPDGVQLLLCPNHHVRQHSLLRYRVERWQAKLEPEWSVLEHFTEDERNAATFALGCWVADGTPAIATWNVPPAR